MKLNRHPTQEILFDTIARFAKSLYVLMLVATLGLCLQVQASAAPNSHSHRKITDQGITDAVQQALMLNRGVSAQMIDVQTAHGIVRLCGSTDNLLAKKTAAKIAKSVRGVRSVINEIKVKPLRL